MDSNFEVAAKVMLEHMKANAYSASVICAHKACVKLLGEYLEKERVSCDSETVEIWLAANTAEWPLWKFRSYQTAANRIVDVMGYGHVLENVRSYRGPGLYAQLPQWAKKAVDHHKDSYSRSAQATLDYEIICCSHFLCYVVGEGATSATDINLELLLGYQRLAGAAKSTKARRISAARNLLSEMRDRGEVAPWVPMLMNPLFSMHMSCYAPVFDIDIQHGNCIEADSFWAQAECFIANEIQAVGYAKTPRKVFAKALRMLYIYLALNELPYSYSIALSWVEANKEDIGSAWRSYRRAFFLFENWRADGILDIESILQTRPDPMGTLPSWAKSEAEAFLELRKREGFARSTINSSRSAVSRFITYLDDHGIRKYEDIDAALVSSFCQEDPHETPEGRSCYVSKVRTYLEYLADEGLAKNNLMLAADPASAPKRKVVKVLAEDQLEILLRAIAAAESPMELRCAAMVAMGLTMGLRASDIANLKLKELSWKTSTITFHQRKTNIETTLPLSTVAGNAIVAYLRNGRPKCRSEYLFVKHRTPYTRLCPNVCGKSYAKMLDAKSADFHTLRRSFATAMLRGGVGHDSIADALGHSTNLSVHGYLSLDEARIAECALSLEECGIRPGGFHA